VLSSTSACFSGAKSRIPAVARRNKGVWRWRDGGTCVLACSRSGLRYAATPSGLSANEDIPTRELDMAQSRLERVPDLVLPSLPSRRLAEYLSQL